MGFFGGLVMSAIKRDRGVKDWGWMIEGHGGVLDRLDSVIFAAPVFFHTVRYFWAVCGVRSCFLPDCPLKRRGPSMSGVLRSGQSCKKQDLTPYLIVFT